MSVKGFWFDTDSSTRSNALFEVEAGEYRLTVEGILVRHGDFLDLNVSDRLGDMPRRIIWPDGAVMETSDNAAVDRWLSEAGHKGSWSVMLHRLENNWRWVLGALVVTVLCAYVGIRFGLPAASDSIAHKLPPSVNETASEQSLAFLDRFVFDESEVSDAERAQVQQQFDALVAVGVYDLL